MTVLSAAAIGLEGVEDDGALAYKMRWFVVATDLRRLPSEVGHGTDSTDAELVMAYGVFHAPHWLRRKPLDAYNAHFGGLGERSSPSHMTLAGRATSESDTLPKKDKMPALVHHTSNAGASALG
jgi:hypothetical protein